ncbi:MAG: hypothetical protein AAB834_06235, partial [Patescibacteria group bacterium]
MNKKDVLIYTCIMLLCSFLALEVVAHALTGESFVPNISTVFKSAPEKTVDADFRCSDKPAIKDLDKAKDPQLRKLAGYQKLCNSQLTNHMMIFNDMPKDDVEAVKKAE